MSPDFPELPILQPEPARRSDSERFGGLRTLGLGGLVVLGALLGWFGWNAWSLRDVWRRVYVLNDPGHPEEARIAAAWALSHEPGLNSRQRWDLALSRVPPDLGRYLLAESLTAEAIAADPSAYALAVARSEGWPVWLRLLLIRPMAYDDGRHELPAAPLAELRRRADPATRLWAAYVLVVNQRDPEAADALEKTARGDEPGAPLARLLRDASRAERARRPRLLDEATLWLRARHPDAARLWASWEVREGRIRRRNGG